MIRSPFALDLDLGDHNNNFRAWPYADSILAGRIVQPAFEGTPADGALKARGIRDYFKGQKRWKASPPRGREVLSLIQWRQKEGYALTQTVLVALEHSLGVADYTERRRQATTIARIEAYMQTVGVRFSAKGVAEVYGAAGDYFAERTLHYWREAPGYAARLRHFRAFYRRDPDGQPDNFNPEWERMKPGLLLPKIVGALKFGSPIQKRAARRTIADLAAFRASQRVTLGKPLVNAIALAFNAKITAKPLHDL